MILSLRTTSYTAAAFIALILGFLLLLGSWQYRAHKDYRQIIQQNEKIIFQFATIREHITESLLENRTSQLSSITSEIENLSVNISQVLQQPVIPDEHRISFAGQVDFAGIIILLRSIASGDHSQAKIRQLNMEVRILSERLLLFDRVIADHVKRKLVGFQSFVIGVLAIILCIIVSLLLFWHARFAIPLIDLTRQAQEAVAGKRAALAAKKWRGEVGSLARAFQHLLAVHRRNAGELARHDRVLETADKVSQSVWQARTRDEIFSKACRNVLTNTDYALAWISVPEDDNFLAPVTMDGSTTMSRREQDECITALLAAGREGEEKYNIAARAARQKEPVIYRDILQGLNSGPFKNTPLATGTDCIALPFVHDGQVLGVMTICSISPDSLSRGEIGLLGTMSRDIGFAVSALAARETGRTLARLQAAQNKAFSLFHDLVLVLDASGKILETAPSVAEKLNCGPDSLIGKGAAEVFQANASPPLQLPSVGAGSPECLSYEVNLGGTEYMVHISPLENLSSAEQIYLLVARDISEQKKQRRETMRASRLAAMGEISVGVTNELNNLTNGLINYTQILSDEMKESGTTSRQSDDLLNKLMGEGEKISQVVQQLLFFNGGNSSHGTESVRINKIIEDSLALTRYQFRYDAIDVATGFPDNVPPVRGNVKELQHIFINLLSNARYALNQRYPGQDPQKRIEITGKVQARNGHHCLRVACTDFGVGIDPGIISKVCNPFFSTKPEGIGTGLGLSICRSIIEDYRGSLEIESTPGEHTTITLELPIAA